MSSSIDAGKTANESQKIKDSPCLSLKSSKDGKHKWRQKGSWPSLWWECKHCGVTRYSK
jgi:hypothetical protein